MSYNTIKYDHSKKNILFDSALFKNDSNKK